MPRIRPDACVPRYHAACDDLSGIDMRSLELNIDVIADAVGTYAYDLPSPDASTARAPVA